ncbi:hypothetical protein ACWCYY_18175 [Kitasatospora sp. NPDC001664]
MGLIEKTEHTASMPLNSGRLVASRTPGHSSCLTLAVHDERPGPGMPNHPAQATPTELREMARYFVRQADALETQNRARETERRMAMREHVASTHGSPTRPMWGSI